MARLDKAAITASLTASLPATVDETGVADLVADQGQIVVAAEAASIDPAIARLRPLPGRRWIAINPGDLFVASPKTIGTKVGIMDPSGRVLKNADLPRPTAS